MNETQHMSTINKPGPISYLFFAFAVLVIVSSFFSPFKTLDVPVYDSFFVTTPLHISFLIAAVILLLSVTYWMARDVFASSRLSWLHLILTIGILGVGVYFWFFHIPDPATKKAAAAGAEENEAWWPMVLAFVFLLAQIVYLLNLLKGIIRKLLALMR